MNTYQIHYFGMLSERRGVADESVSSPEMTARGLYESLAAEHRFGMSHQDLRAAVNDEMVAWDYLLKDGDHIAFLPPMSGG